MGGMGGVQFCGSDPNVCPTAHNCSAGGRAGRKPLQVGSQRGVRAALGTDGRSHWQAGHIGRRMHTTRAVLSDISCDHEAKECRLAISKHVLER